MSLGTKSPLFKPVNASMLPTLKNHFKNITCEMIDDIYQIMTKNLVTESLLFTGIISMIDRFLSGEREDEPNYGKYGAGIKLSAVEKNGKYKMQSPVMELLHDVIVELQMAGSNFRNLQKYLELHNMAIATLHSCYMFVLNTSDLDGFYENCGEDQMRRTGLDWTSETIKNVTNKELFLQTEYTTREAEIAQECYDLTVKMIEF